MIPFTRKLEGKLRRSRRASGLCLLVIWTCSVASAVKTYRTIDQFFHRAWTAKDGAPGEITSLAQTSDSYLWIGTTSGLYRFDGVHFEKYQLPKDNVLTLSASRNGGLWICYYFGGISFLRDGQVTHYGERDGLPASPVGRVVTDRQGFAWAATTDNALMRLEDKRWRAIGEEWDFSGSPEDLLVDRVGTLWVETSTKLFFLLEGSKKFQQRTIEVADVIAESDSGEAWARRGKLEAGPRLKLLTRDIEGGWWRTALDGGIEYTRPGRNSNSLVEGEQAPGRFRQREGLTGDRVTAWLRDAEGSIWVATNLGLDQFRSSPIVPVRLPATHSKFALVPSDHGGIWATAYFGASGGSLFDIRADGVAWEQPAIGAMSAYRDPDGALWIGTRGKGILRWQGSKMQNIPVDSPMVGAFTMDPLGRLWALFSAKGFFRGENGKWTTSLASLGAPGHGHLSSFTDAKGRVWFGRQRDRVTLLDQDKLSQLSGKDGISVGDVTTVQGRGGSVWIGGERGLEMFTGNRFVPLLPTNSPGFAGITAIVETAGDGLWIGERRGIVHVPAAELQLFRQDTSHRVAVRIYDALDGLPAPLQPPFPVPAAAEDSNGLIWFATATGVVWIDPKQSPGSAPPPHVEILLLSSKGQVYNHDRDRLQLPAHTTDLRIEYTATSLAVPERVRFRYQLEGQDKEWIEAGTRREAFYTNLKPSTYRFHVVACNSDGLWNETGAKLDFVIAAAFYQTWWFQFLYVALGAAALWLFYRYRLSLATARIQQRLGARMEERQRIARELHDTLLQGFQGLMLRLQAVMKTLPAGDPAHQMIEKVLDRADGVLLEGRESVRNLREEGATGEELSEAMAKTGDDLSQSHTACFSLSVLGTPKPLSPIVFHEARLIAQEALINGFRHARASKLEAELSYTAEGVSLRIRDDGIGIDQATLQEGKSGHWGLSGMRERAQKVGAKLSIWSKPGAGTEIELEIPAGIAYTVSFLDDEEKTPWARSKVFERNRWGF